MQNENCPHRLQDVETELNDYHQMILIYLLRRFHFLNLSTIFNFTYSFFITNA